ncbi:PREDICTED: E3 SUMO-protein ligase SIZ1-like isoform X1 [Lupinus angustifolius]|uniref:E3 SUMO-protein ligase SIZ1-like isoform X1 n=2 Tax=Lupinus angustifolius TaxID=3871 RepID=UPI00092F68F0|nr:PREDICTED: E3 SUMO-protein ligase SIZ1-like isoform X1 [Lupinus angustifolius]XP_019447902.1 PREDICTED: E3 SUMO-protein ligase SIZ1-like isoform X1 [Lupinus angustifolius]XP_019447903.1 PREDICTED: E3 SUMO-protein ligase SIZ1-like isoform X1 [Lupinus angustifolius]
MDLVSSCKEKLTYFRIKELKDVLTQLGLSKQGKKQDLVDRILSILSDEQVSRMWAKKNAVGKEQVAKLVDDTYRKLQGSGATDLASKGQGASDSSNVNVNVKAEIDDSFQSDTKIRCLCGSSLETEPLIKCEDTRCHVWQHINCVIIPEKPMEGTPPVPDKFYCETCRLSRADPFWVSMAHPLLPVRLTTTSIPTDGTNPVQSVEKTFQLTRADKDLITRPEFDVQAWCMLLNDKVSFRMQWPQYTDLQINGFSVRAINRPGSQLLGANGRDDGPIITPYTKDGVNKICLTGCDVRIFCLGVRIVRRRSMLQILNMIPKESEGERFEDALARVVSCVGGGNASDNADSDSDLEVVSDTFSINLRCPMSGSRMKIAGRFKPCVHMGCFDLEIFVEMNQRSRKWQCPICLKNYALENIIIDPYFNRITKMMRNCGEEVTEVEVKPDGSWRVKAKGEIERMELGNLSQWRCPDGSLSVSTGGEVNSVETSKLKQGGVSDSPAGLRLGIRKNCNGVWEVNKPDGTNTSSGNRLIKDFGNHEHVVIPMSSSSTGSGRDGDDRSVNQGGAGHIDYSTANGIEMDSLYHNNVDSAHGYAAHNTSAPVGAAEVIILSDSDEDNDILASPTLGYENNQTGDAGVVYSVPSHEVIDSYAEDQQLGGNPCSGLYNNPEEDDFGFSSSLWSLPSGTQAGPGFQLFSSDVDVSDALVHLQHGDINCSSSLNGYTLAPDTAALGSSTLIPDSSARRSDADLNGGLVDNPVPFAGEDPSLQIFLPTRPADSSVQDELRDQEDVSNGICTENWISLSLGGGASCSNGDASTTNGLNSRQQITSKEGPSNTSTDTASLLLGMNDVRSDKESRQRSDSPFSFPRQKRSVRPRLYLSIDSDSE